MNVQWVTRTGLRGEQGFACRVFGSQHLEFDAINDERAVPDSEFAVLKVFEAGPDGHAAYL